MSDYAARLEKMDKISKFTVGVSPKLLILGVEALLFEENNYIMYATKIHIFARNFFVGGNT